MHLNVWETPKKKQKPTNNINRAKKTMVIAIRKLRKIGEKEKKKKKKKKRERVMKM